MSVEDKAAIQLDSIQQRVRYSPLSMSTPFLCTLTVQALLHSPTVLTARSTLTLHTIYDQALQYHYHGPGLRKVWSKVLSALLERHVSERARKLWLSESAHDFGALLALCTYLDGK